MLEKLKARFEDLKKIVDQSVTNHNSLVGRLTEVSELIKFAEDEATKIKTDITQEVTHVEGELV